MATKCVRLGHKVSKAVELRILRVIQECQICKDEDRTFSHGHGKKYKTAFNTDILVRREKVIGDYYYTDLFSLECMDTGPGILVIWGEWGQFWYAKKCIFYLRSDRRHSEPTSRRQDKR